MKKNYWDYVCGTNAFTHLGLKKVDKKSLKLYDSWYMNQMYPYLYKYLGNIELRNQSILEVGLGFGTVGQYLFERAKKYIGIDLVANPVKLMKYRIKISRYSKKAFTEIGDVMKLKYKDNTFDFVVSIGCIHHTVNINKCISEIHRVLKPNGKALVMVYNKFSLRMLLQNPLVYILQVVRSSINRDYRNFVKHSFDNDMKGNLPEITNYYGYLAIRNLFRNKFRQVFVTIENFDDLHIPIIKKTISRKYLLNNIARLLGLDLYIIAFK